ncbi:hypothetical protein BATDEDRAFT_91289 [Batrachochytrium dendrobatidis JAM81]|uniref:Uncharacterized protein n=1 Tax=Batrachochytrium dendrobatidis (strain JAM81 / FGSC 10211) TaxID=684364 RepID=F4PA84_BATDJ|nr:uncharacterized protein BATDEDRAFT_91289 [Batrachochytrium dendrobatidis JAM81]EGF77858.1 hypothetical protein BATDEDRAFT_91289 [Batrachochytrium dendrobatidis JAM81]|eukprot:XP_006681497.1 hypothetical protein BATDEDRAFT_91289 [Batrachochytrium dendrobatidis JAM81]
MGRPFVLDWVTSVYDSLDSHSESVLPTGSQQGSREGTQPGFQQGFQQGSQLGFQEGSQEGSQSFQQGSLSGSESFPTHIWSDNSNHPIYSPPPHNLTSIRHLLSETRNLTVVDFKMYIHLLLGRMTMSAKEAITELLWSTLSPHQQQLFALPYFGNRWSDDEILQGLQSPWLSRTQQMHSNRELARVAATSRRGLDPTSHDSTALNSQPARSFSGSVTSFLRDVSISDRPPPRPYVQVPTFSSAESTVRHAAMRNVSPTSPSRSAPATNTTSQNISTFLSPSDPPFLPFNRLDIGRSRSMALEDQVFAVLIEAIVRAERADRANATTSTANPSTLARLPSATSPSTQPRETDPLNSLSVYGMQHPRLPSATPPITPVAGLIPGQILPTAIPSLSSLVPRVLQDTSIVIRPLTRTPLTAPLASASSTSPIASNRSTDVDSSEIIRL